MADLVADARNVTYSGQALFVAGGAAVDDGGGGLYIWDAASTAADDGAEIIKPTAIDVGDPGRWRRVSQNVEGYAPKRFNPVTESGTARTNTSADVENFVEWTSESAKTFTIESGVASDGDTWSGVNTGTNALTLAAGSGATLVGDLVFATGKAYSIVFITNSRAIVIGGA